MSELIFNADERVVLRALTAEPQTVVALATVCWPDGRVLGDLDPNVKGADRKHEAHGYGLSA